MSRLYIDGKYLVPEPGITGELADANGLTTLQVPVNFPTIAEAFAMDPLRVAEQAGITGVKLIGSPLEQSETKEYLVTYKFQGISAQNWNTNIADTKATYQLRSSDMEIAVGMHPNFPNLKTKYGFTPDDATKPQGPGKFNYLMPDGVTKSPMYGVEAWLSTGAEFTKTYLLKSNMPVAAWALVGTIVANPPDLQRVFGIVAQQGRKWLVRPPDEETLGSAKRVTEKWRLTGPNFAQGDLYKYSGTL